MVLRDGGLREVRLLLLHLAYALGKRRFAKGPRRRAGTRDAGHQFSLLPHMTETSAANVGLGDTNKIIAITRSDTSSTHKYQAIPQIVTITQSAALLVL